MASNLVLKVSADTKDAAQKLRSLGVDVEVVEAKTKKATKETSAWDKAMKKASEDNVKNFVKLGASVLSIATVVNGLQKGIKACFDEALKHNAEATKKLNDIQTVWTNIKADFGQGLLDSVTPALDALYESLKRIEELVNSNVSAVTLSKAAQNAAKKGESVDFTGYSSTLLEATLKSISTNSHFGDYGYDYLDKAYRMVEDALAVVNARGGYGLSTTIPTGSAGGGGGVYSSGGGYNYNGRNYGTYSDAYAAMMADRQRRDSIANGNGLNWGVNTGTGQGVSYTPTDRNAQSRYEASFLDGQNYAHNRALELIEEEKQKRIDALQETISEYKSFYDEISSYAVGAFDAMNDCMNTYYNNQIAQIKKSGLAEEDMAAKIDEVREKQFEANKANSISQVLIDTASSIMNIWAQHAGNPVTAGILTGLASSTSAMQIAAISGQQYTGLASGGIVSSPTHALIGEGAEKEAVIPLSKLKDFVNPEEGRGAINIVVNVADGSDNSDIAEKVYFAIERAQRTGLLPRWKYA